MPGVGIPGGGGQGTSTQQQLRPPTPRNKVGRQQALLPPSIAASGQGVTGDNTPKSSISLKRAPPPQNGLGRLLQSLLQTQIPREDNYQALKLTWG